ncbi:MAG TPA: cupin domain-containing protein [Solirubrobacterales bacterium]
MLVRRFSEATAIDVHRLRAHVLMDAGELGSRNLSVSWVEVPPGASERLRSHEEAELAYIVARGRGRMSATGDTRELSEGDLVLIPPATDHSVANDGDETLALVSVQSPGVSAEELFSRRLALQAAGYDDDYDYE